MLGAFPGSSEHQGILEINHELQSLSDLPMFDMRKDGIGGLTLFQNRLPAMAQKLYTVPVVKKLYEKRKDFDLIIINHLFNEVSRSL